MPFAEIGPVSGRYRTYASCLFSLGLDALRATLDPHLHGRIEVTVHRDHLLRAIRTDLVLSDELSTLALFEDQEEQIRLLVATAEVYAAQNNLSVTYEGSYIRFERKL